jgi:[acyl-carrier-protein] S-malonyltransferase
MKRIALFPGQGSQYVGMVKSFVDNDSHAAEMLNKANEILGFDLGKIMFEGPEDLLKQTENTQPALFISSAIAYEMVKKKGITFDFVAGHSLGEYSALYAAGALSFEDALKLVRLRGELMAQAGEKSPGSMAAVLGLEDEALDAKLVNQEGVVAANYNCPGQIVISGERDGVQKFSADLQAEGVKVVTLPVSGAFHSPLMGFAIEGLREGLKKANWQKLCIPLISNVNASITEHSEAVPELLVSQLTGSVQWTKSMRLAESLGVSEAVEIGSGKVLFGLMRKISRSIKVTVIDQFSDLDKLGEANV